MDVDNEKVFCLMPLSRNGAALGGERPVPSTLQTFEPLALASGLARVTFSRKLPDASAYGSW